MMHGQDNIIIGHRCYRRLHCIRLTIVLIALVSDAIIYHTLNQNLFIHAFKPVVIRRMIRRRFGASWNYLSSRASTEGGFDEADWFNPSQQQQKRRPTPSLPTQYFLTLASSQFELMANSLNFNIFLDDDENNLSSSQTTKVKQAALYLPQENAITGQLEFLPMLIYPNPLDERIFIANQIGSGLPLHVPKVLTKLPGFQNAQSLIPQYPFVTRDESQDHANAGDFIASGCGTVEEVLCDPTGRSGAALSVPIFHASQTVGVVLVWPNPVPSRISEEKRKFMNSSSIWTEEDKKQISRVAYGLSMALMMDREKREMEDMHTYTQMQVEQLRVALSDNLHQIKNPLQALRAFGKLLQRKVALEEELGSPDKEAQLRSLADQMIIQSDRVIDLLLPMDSMLAALEPESEKDLYLVGKDTSQRNVNELLDDGLRLNPRSGMIVGNNSTFSDRSSSHSFYSEGKKSRNRVGDSKNEGSNDQLQTTTSSSYANNLGRAASIGDFEMQMTFLSDFINPILMASSAIAEENGILFGVEGADDDELPGVMICPGSLQECLSNILENAIKYVSLEVRDKPRIHVTLLSNEPILKPGVSIYIEDNGPGIPASERDDVFVRGYRGVTVKDRAQGDGIGLSVCKDMIHRMGGIIDVLDIGPRGLGGATFRVVLFRNLV